MTERLTHQSVQFLYPFELEGMEGKQPPGIYDVETTEEQLESLSFVAYRLKYVTIVSRILGSSRLSQQSIIDPLDLAEALDRDAAASGAK